MLAMVRRMTVEVLALSAAAVLPALERVCHRNADEPLLEPLPLAITPGRAHGGQAD